jgi:hypothetical protein
MSAKSVPTFEDRGVSHGQCGGSPTAVISVFLTGFSAITNIIFAYPQPVVHRLGTTDLDRYTYIVNCCDL